MHEFKFRLRFMGTSGFIEHRITVKARTYLAAFQKVLDEVKKEDFPYKSLRQIDLEDVY